jgi:F-type H+-transporting ATPase subunit gamma
VSGKLKEVRDRIGSINSTQQITSAMKMVSAAKLRKAQDAITQMRPYADRLNKMLVNIVSNLEGDLNTKLHESRDIEKVLLVVVTSNRGLCGAFNANIIKKAEEIFLEEFDKQRKTGNMDIMCIGKRGNDYFKKHHKDISLIEDNLLAFDDLSSDHINEISGLILEQFESGDYDRVDVAYASFKNAAVQIPTVEQFLPIQELDVDEQVDDGFKADYIFEPDKTALLEHLIPSILKNNFHKLLLDTHASEHGARMTAMENATENAKELLRDLKLEYNKARQEAITSELSEIVGGAAALE